MRWEDVPEIFANSLRHIIRQYADGDDNHVDGSGSPGGLSTLQQIGLRTNSSRVVQPNSTSIGTNQAEPIELNNIINQSRTAMNGNVSLRILLIVQSGDDFTLSQIALGTLSTAEFFDRLKSEYLRLRGFWRRLFSVWRYHHCDFYKVCKLNILVHV